MKRILPFKTGVLAVLLFTAIFQYSCKKDADSTVVPTVTTNAVLSDVSSTTATAGGLISSIGGGSLTAIGVAYSATNQTPTTGDTNLPATTIAVGFSLNLTGLTAGTTYYLRAYATNAGGTAYGAVVKFTTPTTASTTVATVSTFAGNGTGGLVNGSGASAQFYNPQGIVADAQGNFYVSDQFNHVIRKITAAGVVSTFCGSGVLGHADGAANAAQFYSPNGLAIDAAGNIYVADEGNNLIVKITPAGFATTIAGTGVAAYVNSTNPFAAAFSAPKGVALDSQGNIYVTDSGNNRIREISAAGVVTTYAGATPGFVDDVGVAALFNNPAAIVIDSKGNIYVGDLNNHAIRKITSGVTVATIAGNRVATTQVGNALAFAVDGSDNLYVADGAGRVLRLINTTNILNTLAGTTGVAGFADGVGTAAQFNQPAGVAISGGNVYVSDYGNNRIRKIVVTN